MPSANDAPKLYSSLASWFHLLTAPSDYVEEAEFVRHVLTETGDNSVKTVLELGCGGGNNAFHLKNSFDMTLLDLSSEMLDLCRGINPECGHILGDMRTARVGRKFDAVFVHDAVMYLTTLSDLKQSMETAFVHCRRGALALFMPDFVKETFVNCVHHGGHDGDGRSLRYLEWTFDPYPSDSVYTVDFVYLLREAALPVRVEHDTHLHGLFAKDLWLQLLNEVGFKSCALEDPYGRCVFLGKA